MEPIEAQYLILNALETLGLLNDRVYDEDTDIWWILTPSPMLPTSLLVQSGDIVPITWQSEL